MLDRATLLVCDASPDLLWITVWAEVMSTAYGNWY